MIETELFKTRLSMLSFRWKPEEAVPPGNAAWVGAFVGQPAAAVEGILRRAGSNRKNLAVVGQLKHPRSRVVVRRKQ